MKPTKMNWGIRYVFINNRNGSVEGGPLCTVILGRNLITVDADAPFDHHNSRKASNRVMLAAWPFPDVGVQARTRSQPQPAPCKSPERAPRVTSCSAGSSALRWKRAPRSCIAPRLRNASNTHRISASPVGMMTKRPFYPP